MPADTTGNGQPGLRSVSGIYPHLATFNNEGECGTGAVVPWADRLWVISYAPHMPKGSSDKLYEITPDLRQIIRPESIGGTPANRFIHRESNQLFIGPYVIDSQRNVRVIPYSSMYGRHTGNARHLTEPETKIYYATMEEGIYELDVRTLGVKTLWLDEQLKSGGLHSSLPGYHGKGFYSGQGRMVYANNGERGKRAQTDPTTESGVLAEWDGRAAGWTIIRRNQFTEVTGPGGLYGNANPSSDPIWTVGWDHRSLILQVLAKGEWHAFRLPKASHCYDGAHGWNTEWPRIREIDTSDSLLMTMHGMFWRFPRTFSPGQTSGIAPRSSYLKVVGDFCRWGDRVVLGCDDSAKSEFLNKRRTKGAISGPGQSQSNLWFVAPETLDRLGPPIARGAVWLNDSIQPNTPSDPFLFSGFDRRGLHLSHKEESDISFTLQIDRDGSGRWSDWRTIVIPQDGSSWITFAAEDRAAWIRIRAAQPARGVTAVFHYSNVDARKAESSPIFDGITRCGEPTSLGGLVKALGENKRTLGLAVDTSDTPPDTSGGYYELDDALRLKPCLRKNEESQLRRQIAIPKDVITVDAASVLIIDDAGRRWRLPRGDVEFDQTGPLGMERLDREVCTERDLVNVHGTFYELPAENAGGFSRIRPIASHNLRIKDYCSYRGMLVLTGVNPAAGASEHIVRSEDGKAALWLGTVDDLWSLGRPRGSGGPWAASPVEPDVPSDPYLFSGYEKKSLELSHDSDVSIRFSVEIDATGTGSWTVWQTLDVAKNEKRILRFPETLQAYWVRLKASKTCRGTALFRYD